MALISRNYRVVIIGGILISRWSHCSYKTFNTSY